MQNTGNRTLNSTTNSIDSILIHIHSHPDAGAVVQEDTRQDLPSMFVPSTPATLEGIPADVTNMIFTHAAMPVEFHQGLVALAKTSKTMRTTVRHFMRHDDNGKVFATALKIGPVPHWHAQAKALIQNAKIYRKDFPGSAASVCNNVSMKLSGEMASGALTRFKAIAFNLNKFDFNPAVIEQISSIRAKPVKINASKFNGELHTLQTILQSVFAAVHTSCPLILDLSMNGLRAADLRPLLEIMQIKPIIYQLSLDGNPLCTDQQLAQEVVQLVELVSPISHLYLSKTGFNDATASGLGKVLAGHRCLAHLDLRSNSITVAGALALTAAVDSVKETFPRSGVLQRVRLQQNKFRKPEVIAAAPQGLRSMDIVQLEDMTIFSSNFSLEELNQEKILIQAEDNQRL